MAPRSAPRPTQRAAPDTTRRLESLEVTLKLVLEKVDDLSGSVRNLREKDGDMEAALVRFTVEQRRQSDSLSDALKQQQATFSVALVAEAEARKTQGEEFRKALKEQADESRKALKEQGDVAVETIRAAMFKGIANQIGTWVITALTSMVMLGLSASYFWPKARS